ncbi:MAG: class I SAM-dependent methyltransferase [Alphaproteobacteria bacterium]|nr:class I SAM-dependent methyltransferase [Alphaproteobacteria bacterium]
MSTRSKTAIDQAVAGAVAALEAGDAGALARLAALAEEAPRNPRAHLAHAMALEAAMRPAEAIAAYSRALARDRKLDAAAQRLAVLLESHGAVSPDTLDRRGLIAGLNHPGIDPQPLARAGFAWLKNHGALAAPIARGRAEGWAAAAETLLSRRNDEALADPLLLTCLEQGSNADSEIELLLTALRRALSLNPALVERKTARAFACALARQARFCDYVWYADTQERDADANGLLQALYSLPAAGIDARPRAFALMLAEAHSEAEAERKLAADMPTLGALSDATSGAVAAQYEANPYPRWQRLTRPRPGAYAQDMAHFVGAAPPRNPEMLIAGCGTGQQAIAAALGYGEQARITALDLSRASLAYGARRARDYDVDRIRFIQGDILEAAKLGRRFAVIECIGVLHHMADPLAGWRALAECLAPGGAMLIGLYSATARQEIAALRKEIASRGLDADPDTIRAFRHELMTDTEQRWEQTLSSPDFYGLNRCRDLLFHAHERPVTIPEIGAWLDELGLAFRGFALPEARIARFRLEHPEADPMRDLDAWAVFEATHPRTFAAMYQFWCVSSPPHAA